MKYLKKPWETEIFRRYDDWCYLVYQYRQVKKFEFSESIFTQNLNRDRDLNWNRTDSHHSANASIFASFFMFKLSTYRWYPQYPDIAVTPWSGGTREQEKKGGTREEYFSFLSL